jgi:hypothetical protein
MMTTQHGTGVPSKITMAKRESYPSGKITHRYAVELVEIDLFPLPEGVIVAPLFKVSEQDGRVDGIDFSFASLYLLSEVESALKSKSLPRSITFLEGMFVHDDPSTGLVRMFQGPQFVEHSADPAVRSLPSTTTKYDLCIELDHQYLALPRP